MSLYNDASLIMYPSGYKASKIYSQKPTDGSGDLAFTRASTATRVNESGLIESVASNVPRIDYLNGCGQLLLEPQRTNHFTHSENINNFSPLGRLNCGYTLGSSFASFGTSCLITSTSFTGSYIKAVLNFNSINTENNYFTIRIKKKSGWYLVVQGANGCSIGILSVNLASGGGYISSSGTMQTDYKVIEFDEYFEIGFKTTQNSTTAAGLVNLNLYDNASFSNYNDAGGTTFNISGIQWENQQTYGTSYIPTSGATATRLADVSTLANVRTNGLIGASAGTLYVNIKGNTARTRITADTSLFLGTTAAGETNSLVIIQPSGSSRLQIGKYVSGVYTSLYTTTTDEIKVAFKWNGTTADVYVNGTKQVSATSFTATSLEYLEMGGVDIAKNIQSAMLFTTAQLDATLATLTTL